MRPGDAVPGGAGELWGRDAELVGVREFAGRTSSLGDSVVVVGEPGIGKSSLWRVACATARAAGARVLATVCAEAEADMPYVGLDELVGPLLDEFGPALPEVQRAALDAALLRGSPGVPSDSRTVAAGTLALLRRAVDAGPVLIAIDDVHWLDPGSRRCLAFALRRLGVVSPRVLLTLRAASPLWEPGDEADPGPLLDALPSPTTLNLHGLDLAALTGALHSRLDRRLTAAEVRDVAAETGGNPLYAVEYGRALVEAGDPSSAPRSVARLLARRLDQVAPDVLEMGGVVAVLGQPRPYEALAAHRCLTEGEPTADSEALIDAAIRSGLVTATHGVLAPAHPLFSSALVDALPPFRLRRLHQCVAAGAASPDARAHHLLRAAEVLDLASAPDGSQQTAVQRSDLLAALDDGARAAESRGALDSAVRLAEAAVEWDGGAAGIGGATPRRRITAARLRHREASFTRAAELLGSLDLAALDGDELDDAVPVLAASRFRARGEAAARTVTEALAGLPPAPDPTLGSRRRALELTLRGDHLYGDTDRRGPAAEAVRLAAGAGSRPAVRHRTLGNLGLALLDAGDEVEESLLAARRGLEVGVPALASADGTVLLRGLVCQVRDRLDDARGLLEEAVATARTAGDDVGHLTAGVSCAYVALVAGRPGDAEAVVAELPDLIDRNEPEPPALSSIRGMIALARGDRATVEALLPAGGPPDPATSRRGHLLGHLRGLLALHDGRYREAADDLERFTAVAGDRGIHEPARRLMADADLADALIGAGEPDRADAIADSLADRARGRPTLLGVVARIRARTAAAAGRSDEAAAEAARAVEEHRRSPRPPELARSLLVAGEVAGLCGDPDTAAARSDEAIGILTGCGMYGWVGPAARRAAPSSRSGPRRPPAADDPLTPAERLIVDHVSRGSTNREVATSLHLSVRTVEHHLGSVYRKLGIGSRAELIVQRAAQDG